MNIKKGNTKEIFLRGLTLASLLALMLTGVARVEASAKVAGVSAALTLSHQVKIPSFNTASHQTRRFTKRLVIERVLSRHNSPLAHYSDEFVKACTSYNINCYLLPAISGLESYFGLYIYPNSYNPFGWGGGYIKFDDWQEGINTVAYSLKQDYLEKGADTLKEMGRIYAPHSTTWATRVNHFMNEFYGEEKQLKILPLSFVNPTSIIYL